MNAAPLAEVHYRIAGRVGGIVPGHHRSTRGEGGFEFRRYASLFDAPDVRRLDLHASLRDPFGQWRVRINSLRQSIPVAIVADLSASMGFEGAQRKIDVLADFIASLAWSAWRTGDSFGFVGCDDIVRDDWWLPQTRRAAPGGPWPRGCVGCGPARLRRARCAWRNAICRSGALWSFCCRTSICRCPRWPARSTAW